MKERRLSLVLKWIAAILLGLGGLFFLLFGVGEMLAGELGGIMHLFPALLLLVCIPLVWRYPLWGGISLLILGLLMGFRIYILVLRPGVHLPPFQPILGVPFLLPGLLSVITGLLRRQPQTP